GKRDVFSDGDRVIAALAVDLDAANGLGKEMIVADPLAADLDMELPIILRNVDLVLSFCALNNERELGWVVGINLGVRGADGGMGRRLEVISQRRGVGIKLV